MLNHNFLIILLKKNMYFLKYILYNFLDNKYNSGKN
jgi:hypothetical protein